MDSVLLDLNHRSHLTLDLTVLSSIGPKGLLYWIPQSKPRNTFQISGCLSGAEHPILKVILLVPCTNRRYFVLDLTVLSSIGPKGLLYWLPQPKPRNAFQISGCLSGAEHPILKIILLVPCTNRRYFVLLPVMPLLYCVMYTQHGCRVTKLWNYMSNLIAHLYLRVVWMLKQLTCFLKNISVYPAELVSLFSFFHYWLNF